MSRTLKIFLTVSILLNLALLGLLGGMEFREAHHHRAWRDISADLSPQGQALVRDNFQNFRKEMEQDFSEMRDIQSRMREIFTAPEFNPRAFDDASARMDRLRQKMASHRTEAMKRLGLGLSPEDRKKLGERLLRFSGRYRPKKGNP